MNIGVLALHKTNAGNLTDFITVDGQVNSGKHYLNPGIAREWNCTVFVFLLSRAQFLYSFSQIAKLLPKYFDSFGRRKYFFLG